MMTKAKRLRIAFSSVGDAIAVFYDF